LNPQLFLSGYGFRPQASGEFGSESGYFCFVWTEKNFESGKKKLQIQKYPDTCGRGLELPDRPFYSCLLSDLASEWQRPCFDTGIAITSALLLCKSSCSHAN